MLKNQLLCCSAIVLLIAGEVTLNLTPSSGDKWLNINQEALARSSGGRSGGSSGGRSSSSSSSSGSSRSSNTSPSRSSSSNFSRPSNSGNTGRRVRSGSFEKPVAPAPVAAPNTPIPQQSGNNRTVIIERRTYNSRPSYVVPYNSGNSQQNTGSNQQPAVNPAPITTDNNSDSDRNSESSQDGRWFWFLLFVSLGSLALIAYCIYYYRPKSNQENKADIFAIRKLQVAMLAEAREVQQQLTELTLKSDLESAANRAEFLQEAVLIVLRSPESWTHCVASYQTVANREDAAQVFNQISIQERSKFSVETLSMVNGDIRTRQSADDDEEPGEYIIVTFLMGTKNAKPLVGDIRDVGKLKAVLEEMAATPADNLLILEVIWSPQQETDSLTGDDLLGSYSDLIRVG